MGKNTVSDLTNLSDRRLWELLRPGHVREPRLDAQELQRVRLELLSRQRLTANRRYRAPH